MKKFLLKIGECELYRVGRRTDDVVVQEPIASILLSDLLGPLEDAITQLEMLRDPYSNLIWLKTEGDADTQVLHAWRERYENAAERKQRYAWEEANKRQKKKTMSKIEQEEWTTYLRLKEKFKR